MCNLYRMTRNTTEVADWFGGIDEMGGANFGAEVYPGYPGAVLESGKLRQMSWGFPLQMKGKQGQLLKPKPVNNARTDKLEGFVWRSSFEQRRCLIPLTAWAEAEGAKGSKTRSWLSVPGVELFAAAGVWRPTDEWGDAYSMVMTDAAGRAAEVHTRMPVLLAPQDYSVWMDGSPADAFDLCRPWSGELDIDRTDEPWSGGGQARLF
ncbi:MAG: SOS response-associated peptidase family protein [Sphingomonadaceae bacterium]|nr:SOS response-associated peptidase family protein [Sphingomonadaceae bacterium]